MDTEKLKKTAAWLEVIILVMTLILSARTAMGKDKSDTTERQ